MCDAFVKLGHKTSLITSKKKFELKPQQNEERFCIKRQNPFKVLSFSNLSSDNFISRILFGIRTVFFKETKKKLI